MVVPPENYSTKKIDTLDIYNGQFPRSYCGSPIVKVYDLSSYTQLSNSCGSKNISSQPVEPQYINPSERVNIAFGLSAGVSPTLLGLSDLEIAENELNEYFPTFNSPKKIKMTFKELLLIVYIAFLKLLLKVLKGKNNA